MIIVNANNELLEYMYQDTEMATYTITELINDLKGKDNKIMKDLESVLKEYEKYQKDFEKQLKKYNVVLKEKGFMAKMMSSMGIKSEVSHDNSDASIADMLIKGISMGSLDIEKKISQYDKEVDKKILNVAENFLKFQEEKINLFKTYL